MEAVEPRSRRPRSSPRRTPDVVCARIVALRLELTARGLDAGPVTIAWHLEREGLPVPSTSTIRRILHAAGLVVPEPRKRPRSSWIRFEAAAPNELWQSDFTHWRLADGTEVEILNWLDDHSRYLLACTAFRRVSRRRRGGHVHRSRRRPRLACRHAHRQRRGLHVPLHRWPQQLRVPARLPRGPPEERRAGPSPDPGQDRALPPDPQALARAAAGSARRWPRCRPSSTPSASPTTSSGRIGRSAGSTPGEAYRATPKALPAGPGARGHFRLRYDIDRQQGRPSPCAEPAASTTSTSARSMPGGGSWPSSMSSEVTVVALDTGEILSTHRIEPDRRYWRNQRRDPGRWPGSQRSADHM